MTDIVARNQHSGIQSMENMQEGLEAVQALMKQVMVQGKHYAVIPGTKKPSLLQPGAELLFMLFKCSPTFTAIREIDGNGVVRYSATCLAVSRETKEIVGSKVAVCSTAEEKYRWRAAVCAEEFEDTPPERRRVVYKQQYDNGQKSVGKLKQVEMEAADKENTVLAMSQKKGISRTGEDDYWVERSVRV